MAAGPDGSKNSQQTRIVDQFTVHAAAPTDKTLKLGGLRMLIYFLLSLISAAEIGTNFCVLKKKDSYSLRKRVWKKK